MILKQQYWPGPGWRRFHVRFLLCLQTGEVINASPDDVFWSKA